MCKPNIQRSFYKFTVVYGMKHGMYQPIIKINLCCSHYLNETTCANYKKPGFQESPNPNDHLFNHITVKQIAEVYFSTYSCY